MDLETGRNRTGVTVIGLILIVIGVVWSGQGAGYIAGSFMTGQSLWLVIGIVAVSLGIGLIIWGRRRTPRGRSNSPEAD